MQTAYQKIQISCGKMCCRNRLSQTSKTNIIADICSALNDLKCSANSFFSVSNKEERLGAKTEGTVYNGYEGEER